MKLELTETRGGESSIRTRSPRGRTSSRYVSLLSQHSAEYAFALRLRRVAVQCYDPQGLVFSNVLPAKIETL